MSIKEGISEVRGDIKRRLIARIKAQLVPALEAWGIVTPHNIAVAPTTPALGVTANT